MIFFTVSSHLYVHKPRDVHSGERLTHILAVTIYQDLFLWTCGRSIWITATLQQPSVVHFHEESVHLGLQTQRKNRPPRLSAGVVFDLWLSVRGTGAGTEGGGSERKIDRCVTGEWPWWWRPSVTPAAPPARWSCSPPKPRPKRNISSSRRWKCSGRATQCSACSCGALIIR